MLILPGAATVHLNRESRRLTIAGVIEKKDGTFIRCTQHDDDLDIETGDLEGVYFSTASVTGSDIKSATDMSVDNMEVTGQITDESVFTGFTAADIEAGLLDNAPFQTFLCQWDAPNDWQKILRRGYLGEISRTAEGQFQCEWRGLFQLYQQMVGRTYGERCDVKRFGDSRCKINVAPLTQTGTVTAVTSRRRFNASGVTSPDSPFDQRYFDLGELSWITGSNAGYLKQVKRGAVDDVDGRIEMWEAFPFDVQVGDTFSIIPGCDRLFTTCQKYDNVINFRGHGRWIPGIPSIIRAP
jgi:uncharacterized phage protein (TIGR02218 family)